MLKYYFFFLLLIIHLPLISIPTCHIIFEQDIKQDSYYPSYRDKFAHHDHSDNQKDNLFAYSSTQLQQYFEYHHYSEKNILSQNALYISDEFVQLAKTYPGYEKAITKLQRKLNRMWVFKRAAHWLLHGTKLLKRVDHLYKELRKYQRVTTENAKSFAQLYNINLLTLFPHNSSLVTRNIYKNYIDILHRASTIPLYNSIIRDCIGQASGIGLEANKNGHTKLAFQLADLCLTMLDCAAAFDEGIYLGAMQTVDAITHPIKTIKNSLIGIGIIAHGLSKLVSISAECAVLYATDRDYFYIKKDILINQFEMITNNAIRYVQTTPTRNIVKQGSAFIAEGIFLTKICTFAHNISRQLLPIAHNYFEYIVTKEPLACLGSGEIVQIPATQLKSHAFLNESSRFLANTPVTAIAHETKQLFIALAKINQNKIHHILTPKTSKHAWHLVVDDPLNWNQVAHIIKQVLLDGKISTYGPVLKKELCCMGHIVEVIIAPLSDGSFSIADAWVKTR